MISLWGIAQRYRSQKYPTRPVASDHSIAAIMHTCKQASFRQIHACHIAAIASRVKSE